MSQQPTLGRIVLWRTPSNGDVAAVITNVYPGTPFVDLFLFPVLREPMTLDFFSATRTWVPMAAEPPVVPAVNTWRWPERVPT